MNNYNLTSRASAVCNYCKSEPKTDHYFLRALEIVQQSIASAKASASTIAVVVRNRQYNERAQFAPTEAIDNELELLFAVVGGVEAFMQCADYFAEWYLTALNEYEWWRREATLPTLQDLIAAEHYIKPSCNDLHSGQRVAFFTDARTVKVQELLSARGLVDNQIWAQVSGWQLAGYFQYASTFAEAYSTASKDKYEYVGAAGQLPPYLTKR